jgi:signal transduction histidine kinase
VNLATYVSLSAFLVGLLFATVTFSISSAPGTRGLRYFSMACTWGALYAASNATLSTTSFELSRWGIRFGLTFAALHAATWFVYTARREGRALFAYERVFVGGLVLCALVTPIPNLLYHSDEKWSHEVAALGVRYTDARSTWLGNVAFLFIASAACTLLYRSLRRIRTATHTERAEAVGLVILVLCGLNDALETSDAIDSPYLLDLGFLALVVAVGSSLARRFVDNARELETAQAELIQSERLAALGEMSAVVAHEVRNPVAVIFNAAASMRRNPNERDTLLAIVEEEAGRLRQMVTDLLDFARPASVRLVHEPLLPIIESALDAVRNGAGAHAVDVELSVDEEVPALQCDVRLLRQAIVNLVSNALQAPGRKGPVRIAVEMSGPTRVHLTVSDDGAGVPEDIADRIFRPFFTTRATGTGLGLAVVQRIVRAHSGVLSHRDTPGGGATFEMDLPLRQPSDPPEAHR